MAENERLREALLEVEALRDRESRLLAEGNVAVALLSALSQAEHRAAAMALLVDHARDLIGADWGTVVAKDPAGWRDVVADVTVSAPAVNVFSKARNLVDTRSSAGWDAFQAMAPAPVISVLTVPLANAALVLTGQSKAQFSSQNLNSLKRLVALSEGALGSVDVRQNHSLLAAVIAGSSSGFAIADASHDDQPLIFVNAAFEDLSGYAASEVIGRNCRFLNDEPDDSAELARLRKAVQTCTGGRFLLRNKRKSGERFWNDLTLFPVQDAAGTVTHLVATQTDATMRVMAETDRDAVRQRMDHALSHTRDAFVLLDHRMQVQFANDATRDLFPARGLDWRVDTGFGENWAGYVQTVPKSMRPTDPAFLVPDLEAIARQRAGVEVPMPDGRIMLVRGNTTELGGIVVSATDVTALKTAERQTRQRTAAIDNAKDGIGISDAAGRMIYANPSLAALLGAQDPDDVLGLNWQSRYKPGATDGIKSALQADGTGRALCETRTDPVQFHDVSVTVIDRGGTILVVQDVTQRIEDQARQVAAEKALEQARQREVVSDLAAGIAHDFNNILSVINGSAVLLSSEPGLTADMAQHLDRIAKAGKSASKLVNHMLDLGRTDAEDGMFDLKWAMDEAMSLAQASVGGATQLTHRTARAGFPAFGAPNDVVQALINLVINANDALNGEPGRIDVSLDPVVLPPADCDVGQLDADQTYARFRVRDTGSGIPDAVREHMFDPHFSTKGAKGSGVGLSNIASVLNRIGGAVAVSSVLGQGTTIDLYWPLSPDDPGLPDPVADVSLAGQMILVVDDDRAVTDVLQTYLERLGAEVAVCHDPAIALEAVTEDPDDWTALITDYDMPGLSGGDLVAAVRDVTTQLPIFVVTALARRLADHRITRDTVNGVFAKPLNLSKLAQAMAQSLARGQNRDEDTSG